MNPQGDKEQNTYGDKEQNTYGDKEQNTYGDKEQNTYGGSDLSPSKVGGNAAKVGGKKSKRIRRRGGYAEKSVGGRRRSGRRGRKSRRSRK